MRARPIVIGWRLSTTFFIGGPRAADKAETNVRAWLARTRRAFAERGLADYRDVDVEILGAEATYGPHTRARQTREVVAKVGLSHESREALRDFFEVDAKNVAAAALDALGRTGAVSRDDLEQAMKKLGVDAERPDPMYR